MYPILLDSCSFCPRVKFHPSSRIHAQSSFRPQSTNSNHDVLVSGWFLSCTAFCSDTTLCRTYCVPLRISPKKFEKHAFYVETLRRKNGTDLVSKPINWIWSCALRSFLLPHSSDDCSSKSLRRAFVTPFLAITCDYQSSSKCIPFY